LLITVNIDAPVDVVVDTARVIHVDLLRLGVNLSPGIVGVDGVGLIHVRRHGIHTRDVIRTPLVVALHQLRSERVVVFRGNAACSIIGVETLDMGSIRAASREGERENRGEG